MSYVLIKREKCPKLPLKVDEGFTWGFCLVPKRGQKSQRIASPNYYTKTMAGGTWRSIILFPQSLSLPRVMSFPPTCLPSTGLSYSKSFSVGVGKIRWTFTRVIPYVNGPQSQAKHEPLDAPRWIDPRLYPYAFNQSLIECYSSRKSPPQVDYSKQLGFGFGFGFGVAKLLAQLGLFI